MPSTLKIINLVRDEILQNPICFDEVFELIFDEKSKYAWRAAWAIEKVSEKNTAFFSEEKTLRLISFSIKVSQSSKSNSYSNKNSLQRSLLSILINLPIPKNLPVEFINFCFEKMISMKDPVAVQALCMRMLLRISENEPDFIPEIIVTLENIDLTTVSAGYIAIRKNVLSTLYKRMKS